MNRSLTNILPSAAGGASPSAGVGAPSAGFSPSAAAAAAFSSSSFAASLASPATALASASYFECYYKALVQKRQNILLLSWPKNFKIKGGFWECRFVSQS